MSKRLLAKDIKDKFAAAFDCFMGEFLDATHAGDRVGASLASARLSQLGLTMFELFGAGASTCAENDKEHRACHEAAIVVRNMFEKSLDEWSRRSASDFGPN